MRFVRRIVPGCAVLCVLAACTLESGPGNHHGGAGTPFPPASTTSYTLAIGKSTGVAAGQTVGYSLTALGPQSYRIKWTGDSSVTGVLYREFWGSVWTTGHFTSVIPGCANQSCPLEPGENDYVSGVENVAGGQRVDWDTIASTGFDGFDFTTDTEPVYVDPYVDGQRLTTVVFFATAPSGNVQSPAQLPFGVTSM